MKRLQYQSTAQVIAPSYKERITPDKWLANDVQPVRRATSFAILAAATALAFVPVLKTVAPSVASWHQQTEQPVLSAKRQQHLAPNFFFDPLPRPNVVVPVYAGSWHPPIEQPYFGLPRRQYVAQCFVSVVAPVTPQTFRTGTYPVPQVSALFRGSASVLSPDGDRLFTRLFNNVAALQGGAINLQHVTIPRSNYPGTPGQISYDAQYLFICVATDTWKRLPHGDF